LLGKIGGTSTHTGQAVRAEALAGGSLGKIGGTFTAVVRAGTSRRPAWRICRGLPASTVRQLATGAWIGERLNVLVSGATGVGKSYLACALGQMACRQGLGVLYRRVPRLFEELRIARAEGSYARKLLKMAKADLLILDDLGLGHLEEAQRHDLLEVLEDRYGKRATVVTSQLPIRKWHEWIGDPTLADAILDRLVHNAYKVQLKGPSRRKTEATDTN